ncbi:protease modulator HflC [bacterium SCSIO 12643]|nr:protease modulator HflC [bacterium SCSIO 12643]
MQIKSTLYFILGFAFILLLSQSAYVVQEKEQVVVTQFGRPVGDPVLEPGINFKIPFIQKANFFEKRFLEWDGEPNQITTKDKKFIFVDTYARWQITDPLQFFKRLTNERGAQSRLDDILDGATRVFIAKNNIEEAVRSSNRTPISADTMMNAVKDTLHPIFVGRAAIQKQILAEANLQTADLGIEILDFRFKRINYVQEVQNQVFERMKSERFRIADKFRSEGQGEASRINGQKERDLKEIQSVAFRKAEEIKGAADAEAAAIYASAYNKSAQAKSLYAFLKSMETFENTFSGKTSMVLNTDNELYKFLKKMN